MRRVLFDELAGHAGERVAMAGWVHHQRKLSNVTFLLLRDRRGVTQVVVEDDATRAQVDGLASETVISVEGLAVATEQAPGGVEIHDPVVTVLAPAEPAPIDVRMKQLNAALPFLLNHAPIALRHARAKAAARIAAASIAGFRSTLDALDFVEVQTPKIVASATESGANVFALDYFGRKAFLAQSPQFYKQTMVGVFERVYETGPVFRAEAHDTTRHLAEYVSLDVELGFIDDHRDVMALLRDVLAGMLDAVRSRAASALALLASTMPALPDVPEQIPVVDFTEAQQMIESATGERVVGEPDLAPAHERWLGDWAVREFGSDFVFVPGYPRVKRPFYTHPDPDRPDFTNSFDLLFRGVELVTGGQRLHRYEDYLAALAGQDLAPFETYLEAFRHGMPPHGGFAIGLERWVARITGAANVREVTLFPRDLNRLAP